MRILKIVVSDERINRENDLGGFEKLGREIIEKTIHEPRNFSLHTMTYNDCYGTSYCKNWRDYQIDVHFDLNTEQATLDFKYNRFTTRKEVFET